MVLKITELRKEYGIYPTFETEEEKLAYFEEREQAYNNRVAARVAELKDLYNSDKNKYSKFSKFTENDWLEYAKNSLKSDTARTLKCSFAMLPSVESNPEIAQWARFTYEEVLQMEANGTLIPKEVLAWAHSMQDSDVTAYEINDDPNAAEELGQGGVNTGDSELKEMQKKTQTLSKKSENTEKEVNQNFVEFEETAKKAASIQKEMETSKKDSLKQIEEMTQEWELLSEKIKKGSKLSESEQKRYKELGSMLNGQDGELMTELQASSEELENLMNSMDGLNVDIKEGIEIGDETVQSAKQLAMYEKGYKPKNTEKSEFVNMNIGDVADALSDAKGNNIALNAIETGNSLIEFSNTLSSQLMMNQYASLYEFAQTFTQVSAETISNTKEVLGDDFNKTTEEINEEVDAMPDMTNAENERNNLEENGIGLPGQALYFTSKSFKEMANSGKAMIQLKYVQRKAKKEEEKSRLISDIIVDKMSAKKEEYDVLKEKQERAQEKQEASDNAVNNIKDAENIIKASQKAEKTPAAEDFTDKDKQKLEKIDKELNAVGKIGQQKLYASLSKVEGLEQFLASKPMDGQSTIDYGMVTSQVGLELMNSVSNDTFALFVIILGHIASKTGDAAQAVGAENNAMFNETTNKNAANIASIQAKQFAIQDVTTVEAIGVTGVEDEQTPDEAAKENSADETMKDEASTNTGLTVDNTPAAKENNSGRVEESAQNSEKVNNPDSAKDQEKEQEINAANSGKAVSDATNEAKDTAKDSEKATKDTQKTEKQLERESKNIVKQIKQDSKKIEKITKDSENALSEQELLAQEFDALQAQTEAANSRMQAGQSQQQNPTQQGGLLAPSGAQNGNASQDIAVIQVNQSRMGAIAERFTGLGQRIEQNKSKITKLTTSINKRYRKFEKVTKAKIEVQKAAQKKEIEKQKRMQKQLAIVELCNSIYTVIMTVGTILLVVAKLLASNPFTAPAAPAVEIAGNALKFTGLGGIASCGIAKAGILIANGYIDQALKALGATVIQAAMSFIPAGGEAAGNALQLASAGLNLVSSSAQLAANVQAVQGKEQSGWLQTVSQVAGAASAVVGVAGGLQGTFGADSTASTFAKVTQVANAAGTALSTGAQISVMISGEENEATKIIGAIGTGLQTAASLANVVGAASGLNNNKETRQADKAAKAQAKTQKEADKKAKADAKAEAKAEIEAVAEQAGDVEGLPPTEEIVQNPAKAEAEVDKAIADAESALADTDENGIKRIDEEPIVSESAKEYIESEMAKEAVLKQDENFKGIDTSKYNQNKENEIRANLRKEQNQKKFDKATEVLGYVSQGFSTASQMAQAVSSMSKDEDKSVQQRKVLNLSNMKKGKALIKKVKQRRQVSKHFNKYYA